MGYINGMIKQHIYVHRYEWSNICNPYIYCTPSATGFDGMLYVTGYIHVYVYVYVCVCVCVYVYVHVYASGPKTVLVKSTFLGSPTKLLFGPLARVGWGGVGWV